MKKILIVEDDLITSNIYLNRFRVGGFESECADDGMQALELVSSFKPDVVLLDLLIPKLDGVEFLKRLRANPQFKNLPVVVFSNAYQSRLVEQAWKAGANAVLIKASSAPKEVVAKVNQLLAEAVSAVPAASAQAVPLIMSTAPVLPSRPAATGLSSSVHKADQEFRREIVAAFYRRAASLVVELRSHWHQVVTEPGYSKTGAHMTGIVLKLHTLTGNAAVAECSSVAQMSSALEALVSELLLRPQHVNASSLRTVTHGIDFVDWLVKSGRAEAGSALNSCPRVLAVDDDAITRETVKAAVGLAGLECVLAQNPLEALSLLGGQRFDLVLLDVEMPEMNGFELCRRLRTIPEHKDTPVIFVTGMSHFENRVQSIKVGGADLIGKPFLLIELGVKSLMAVYRTRLTSNKSDYELSVA